MTHRNCIATLLIYFYSTSQIASRLSAKENYDIVMETYGNDFCTRHGVEKPPFPYNAGFELFLLPHKLPPPVERLDVGLNLELAIERIKIHPLTCCFMHPPAAGTVISGTLLGLRIVAALEVRDGRTSQLVVAEIISNHEQVQGGPTTAAGKGDCSDAAAMPGQPLFDVLWPWPLPPPGEHIVAKIIDPPTRTTDKTKSTRSSWQMRRT
jgi:hypothetical protein